MSTNIVSKGFVVVQQPRERINAPLLAWESIIDPALITATSAEDDNPVANLVNQSTAFVWRATSAAQQDIDFEVGSVVNYIGIARHNLTGDAQIRIQFLVGGSYLTIFDWFAAPLNQTAFFVINEAEPDGVRISIRNNPTAPTIGVIMCGVYLELQRNIYVGHTPVTYGRTVDTVGGYSENGQYLGELVRREGRSTSVSLENLTPDWYRASLDPFIAQRPRGAAFFVWRPGKYPAEVGYVWLSGNPQPVNQRANGMMSISMDFEAIV